MKVKRILVKIFLCICVAALLVFTGCPVYRIIGLPCPFCGTTRAWLALVHGNFQRAFLLNAFFWLAPILIGWFVFYDELKDGRTKKCINVFLIVLSGIMFAVNIVRITKKI